MDPVIILTILGCTLAVLAVYAVVRVAFALGRASANMPMSLSLVLRFTSALLIGLVLAALFIVTLHVFGMLLSIITAVVTITVFIRRRQMQRRSLLAVLAVSVEKGLPLVPTLTALADEYPGSIGYHTRKLAELLSQGVPLAEAIDQCPGGLPKLAAVYARAGMQVHAPGQALREAAHTQSIQQSIWHGVSGQIFYLAGLVVVGIGLMTFVMIKIIPAFERIYWDFDLELPALTKLLISLSQQAVFAFWPLLLLAMLCVLLVVVMLQGFETGWASRLPIFDRLLTRVHSAVVLRILALATERNRPLEPIFQMLGHSYPHRRIASRLRNLADDVAQGSDWCEGLQQRKLIGPMDLAVLQAAARVGNLPWALREMADSGLRRLALRIQTVVQLVFPCIVFFAGMVVMFIVVSLFLPLVKLINSLA